MAKGSRGGQRSGSSLSGSGQLQPQQQAPQPQQTQVDDTQKPQAFGTQYDAFMKMTDDQKADAISTAISQDIPDHLNKNSDYQKLIYNLGMNDKPTLVDDATLNSMNGAVMYRTVDSVYDRKTDLSFTAPQIAKQVQAGKITRVSNGGTAVYGDGIYFTPRLSGSLSYGSTSGNINKTCVMRMKLNSNAKIINHNDAVSGVRREIANGTKLGKTLAKCNSTSQASIYALAKGYNVIYSNNSADYYNVLNRGAMTMSTTVKAK